MSSILDYPILITNQKERKNKVEPIQILQGIPINTLKQRFLIIKWGNISQKLTTQRSLKIHDNTF